MIFRRAKQPFSVTELEDRDRRKKKDRAHAKDRAEEPGPVEETAEATELTPLPSGDGPYDAAELGLQPDDHTGAVDVGALLVRPRAGMELRLQVDDKSKRVVAAVLVQGSAGVELRAFAAPRSNGLWDDVRREVAAETTRRGGTVTEATGRFGAEVTVVVSTRTADGKTASQASRIVGVDGPRWFIRATFLGTAAVDKDAAAPFEDALADLVVVRGRGPMAPRELIPMKLPEGTNTATNRPNAT